MLPGGTDAAYRAALAGPHQEFTRVEVWRSGVRIDPYGDDGLPLTTGSITATLNSQVTRNLDLTTTEDLWPVNQNGLLNPYGNEFRVFQGVKAGSSPRYEWQTFRGRINEVELGTDGTLNVSAVDRAGDVNDAGFLVPENSRANTPITTEFRRIIVTGVPGASFGRFDAIFGVTPTLSWEWDRGSACDDLANAVAAFWYALANGDFVMRFIPWTVTAPPVITLSDGPGGTLITAAPKRSRENVFNEVMVSGEQADGTPPVFSVQFDNNPASPTFTAGAFGVKSKQIQAPAAQTQEQAVSIGRAAIRQATSLTQSWTVSCGSDASLELGDTVIISARNLPQVTQVVESLTISLVSDPMSISLRGVQPGLTEA